jgi:acyl carrier protein
MEAAEIRDQIKESIATVTGVDPKDVTDLSSYRDDLGLDSLSILEIAINVECFYKIKVPEEQLSQIRTIGDTIKVVQEHLGARMAEACEGASLSQA